MISIFLYDSEYWTISPEETGGNQNVVLQKHTKNSMNRPSKQQGSLKGNDNNTQSHKKTSEIS